jgi:drug/metabolite transporter (DMT)-like permease
LIYRQGAALVVAGAVLWSLNGLVIRWIGPEAGPFQVLFWRSLGLLPVPLAVMALSGRRAPIRAVRDAGLAGVIGGLGLVVAFSGAIFALQATTIANAVFLFAAAPLLTAALAFLLLGEPVRPATWIAIIVAAIGIFTMVRAGLSRGDGPGNLAAILSAIGFAAFMVTLRWARLSDMMPATLIGGLLSIPVAVAVVWLRGESLMLPAQAILLAAGMGMLNIGLGNTLFTLGSRVVPASDLGLLALTEVLLAPLWVWLVLGEGAGAQTLLGGAILLGALMFSTLSGLRIRPVLPPT